MTYGTLWHQKMSADTVWYQSVTSQRCPVTAEVASSSLVVPAIHSNAVRSDRLLKLQPTIIALLSSSPPR